MSIARPAFDVPTAMQHIYDKLAQMGFTPRISIQPSEWDHADGSYVRFLHVHGEVEATHRPEGKRVKDGGRKWRICPSDNNLAAFHGWLDGIADTVRMALGQE